MYTVTRTIVALFPARLIGILALVYSLSVSAGQTTLSELKTEMISGGNEVPIALTRWGNEQGPSILFVHGFLSSSVNWQKQIASDLGDDFNMAAIDLRGHGSAAKPWNPEDYDNTHLWAEDINAAIKAAGMHKPVIVAWSYGGLFTMDYVRHFGTENISGIVIADGTGGLVAPPPPAEETPERTARIERSRSANLHTLLNWTNGFMSYLTADGELPADEMDMIKASAMAVPHYVRRYLREKSTDNSDLVEKLNTPILFITGSSSKNTVQHTTRLVEELADADLHIYDGRLIMTMWYEAERFNADVRDFVSGIE